MERSKPSRGMRRGGLTIVELLSVLGTLSLLLGIIAPAVGSARESARRLDCRNRLKNVGIAISGYEAIERSLPPGWQLTATGDSSFGWATSLLAYLDQKALSQKVHRERAVSDAANADLLGYPVSALICPSDLMEPRFALYLEQDQGHEGFGQTSDTVLLTFPSANFVSVFGAFDPDDLPNTAGDGAFAGQRIVRLSEFNRGLGKTMFVSERTARRLPSTWVGFISDGEDAETRVVGFAGLGPNRGDADESEFDSRHPGLINVLWGDGRVEAIADGIDSDLYRQLARRQSVRE